MAGSDGGLGLETASPKDELISEFNVGWEGMLGRVGDGSRPLGWNSGMVTLLLGRKVLVVEETELDAARPTGKPEIELERFAWEREGLLGLCWPLELTFWMTD
jgi:hypothetical protein